MVRNVIALIAACLALLPLANAAERSFVGAREGVVYARKQQKPNKPVKQKDLRVKKKGALSQQELREHVEDYRTSRRITGIPMVDQKDRAYCVVATVQRHLKYYFPNNDVALHRLANAMNADRRKGTNVGYMVEVLEKYSNNLHLKCHILYNVQADDIVKKYNRRAPDSKKLKLRSGKVDYEEFEELIPRIDYKTWKSVRQDEKSEKKKAWKYIRDNIDNGIPVAWSVWLGLTSEQGRKLKAGGHMRMIIGYDKKKEEIIYTDSWGNEHARKKMDWDDAWAITKIVMTMKPRR